MLKTSLFIILSFTVNFVFPKGLQDSTIKINFLLKPSERVSLFYNYEDILSFKNNSNKDTILTKEIASKKSIEFRYGFVAKKKMFLHKFVLSPTDNILFKLKDTFDIEPINKKAESLFIDVWINSKAESIKAKSDVNALQMYFSKVSQIFKRNQTRIDSLFEEAVINSETKKNWNILVEISYYMALLRVTDNSNISRLPVNYKNIADKVISHVKRLNELESPESKTIIYYLTRYNLLKTNKDAENIYNRIDFLILNRHSLGDNLLVSQALNELKNFPSKSTQPYKLAYHSLEKFIDQNSADNRKYLEKLKYNNFTQISEVAIEEVLGRKTILGQVISSSDKFIFIDLWASWCLPCRYQTPFLEKVKLRMKDKPIRFIGLSTDQEDKAVNWIQALKEDKLFGQVDQYRLIRASDSPLFKFFNVTSIPRYIILNRDGKVLSEKFISPNEKDFEKKLLEIIAEN